MADKYSQEGLQMLRDYVSACPAGETCSCLSCVPMRIILAEHAPTLIPTDAQAHSSGALKR